MLSVRDLLARNEWGGSIYLGMNIFQFLERFFRSLILDDESLGVAQALEAIKVVVESIGGSGIIF